MSRQQIDERVAEYPAAELWDAETRPATGSWQANDGEEHGDWNDVAQMLLGEDIEKLAGSLQYDRLDGKLEQAAATLPAVTGEETRWPNALRLRSSRPARDDDRSSCPLLCSDRGRRAGAAFS